MARKIKDFLPAMEAMLQWCRENPELEGFVGVDMYLNCVYSDAAQVEWMAGVARAFGKGKKDFTGDSMWLFKNFHKEDRAVCVKAVCDRAKVCERRVVGTKDIAERVIPAHTEEIVEWDCGSLLEKAAQLKAAQPALPAPVRQLEAAEAF